MENEQSRIEALEARVAELEATVASLASTGTDARRLSALAPPPPPLTTPPSATQPPPPTGQPVGAPPETAPAPPTRDWELDSETALTWGGVGLVVLAVGFAVNTAIQRGWIGPELQLLGALAIAGGLIGTGLHLRMTRPPWTHTLCSGGVAALFATFASNLFVDLTSTDAAHVLTVLVLIGAVALARFAPSEWVAIVGVLGGLVGWLSISDGEGPFIESGAAFVVGFIVVMAVAVERDWFALRLLAQALALPIVLAFATAAEGDAEIAATLVAAGLVALALFAAPSLGPVDGGWRTVELRLPTVLAPWAWVVLAVIVDGDDRQAGLIALGAAVTVAALAFGLRPRLLASHVVALLVGASVALTFALGLLVDADIVWLAVAVQGVGLLVLARSLDRDWLIVLNAAALLGVTAVFAAIDGIVAWETDAATVDDLIRLGLIVALAVAVRLVDDDRLWRAGGLGLLGLVMIWLGSVLVHLPEGQAAVSLSWAVIGVAVLVTGATRKLPELGHVGLAVLGVTVAKLLLVDMAEVDALWRAGLFLVIGLAFLRLGFLLPQWTGADEPTEADATT
ncbi:MAG: DUF2339 domain-containing protein [Actinomycetota bacterium]